MRYEFKTHKNKAVRPDDGRLSQARRRQNWIEGFITEDMGVSPDKQGRVTITTGENELVNMAADIAVGPKNGHKLNGEQRKELRELIGVLRRGRGRRA